MASVEIFGSGGTPFKQAADGAVFVTGTILNITGSYTGTLPITGTVSVDNLPAGFNANVTASVILTATLTAATASVSNFPTGFYTREGSASALASVGGVIKASAGKLGVVSVLVSGNAGAIHDTSAAVSASGANQIAVVPGGIGVYDFKGFPCANGITFVAGASQTASFSYE